MSHVDSLCAGMDMSAFAERLRLLREARNLSQVRLSELLVLILALITAGKKALQLPTLIR
ncbi:hypothetical protein [Dickeya dianthicola]|uniref:hypothetical protein n=1 Tax=Dickeya dianthicola TaxID=204039 RepID=UPI001FD4A46B|nr:hypothetical protein [Dickeya dianthicola]